MDKKERDALIEKICPGLDGVKRDESGHLVINQTGTLYYNLLQYKFALKLELRGLKMGRGGSLIKSAQAKGFIPANIRTKQQAYDFICELDDEIKQRFDALKKEAREAQEDANV